MPSTKIKTLPDVKLTSAEIHSPDQPYNNPRTKTHVEQIRKRNTDDTEFGTRQILADMAQRPPSYVLDEVALKDVFWDHYCREPVEANLNRLRSDWQPDAVGTIYLSKRPGGKYAGLEGRHRTIVAIEKGMITLPARVYLDLTYEQEAALYNLFNRYSPHSALDRLRGRIEAKVPKALAMTALIKEFGLDWNFDHKNRKNQINAASTIENAYNVWGPKVLRDALALLHDGFGANRGAFQDDTIAGAVQFLARYGGYEFSLAKYDRSRMVQLMRERGLRQFRSEAVQISLAEHLRRSHSFGRAMRSIYNLHLRSAHLPTWPDRFYTESTRELHTARLREVEANLAPEQKSARSLRGWQTRHGKTAAAPVPKA